MSVTGFKSTDIENRAKVEPVTATNFGYKRQGLDVNAMTGLFSLGSATCASGTLPQAVIMSPAFTVRAGDVLEFDSTRTEITSVFGTTYTLGRSITGLTTGSSVNIYRPSYLLVDSTGAIALSGVSDINLAEVGGVATSLGQKAEASSIPVVLATEQDTAKDGTETSQGQFTGIGVLKAAPFEGNPAWAAWPAAENGIPYVSVYAYNDAAQQPVQIIATNDSGTITSGSGMSGLVTRSFIQGPLSSSTSDSRAAYIATGTPGASDPGLVTRNVPTGEQDISYADPVITTGNITANGQTVSVALAGKNSVVFQIGGTYTSVAIIFEGTVDGTNWLTIQACRLDSNTIETASGTISNTRRAWEASVNGLHSFRVRATAYTSGTANIQINAGYSATEPIPAIATHAVTLTSTTITSVVPGTAATNLGKAIDSVPGATDTGIANLAQRVDTPGVLTPANGDYFLLRGNNLGQLWVAAVQSGTWGVNCNDGNGNKLIQSTSSPAATDGGLNVRNMPAGPATGGLPVSVVLNTATLTLIMAANTARKYLYVANTTVYEVGLRLSSNTTNPTINSIRIPGFGTWQSDLMEWQGAVYAISYTAASTVHVSEQT
jgi:hypothetical protein